MQQYYKMLFDDLDAYHAEMRSTGLLEYVSFHQLNIVAGNSQLRAVVIEFVRAIIDTHVVGTTV